jgi:hypothetical protein
MTANNPSKYYPLSGGQFEPVSTGQFEPAKGGQLKPVGGGQLKPDFADGSSNVGSYGITEYENEFLDFTPIEGIRDESDEFDESDNDYDNNYDNDYEDENDWERDYFDAMTDGQLGDYDDFGGDIDDIDTWARG